MRSRRLMVLALITVASAGLALAAQEFGGLTGVEALEARTLDWRQHTTVETFQDLRERERESDIVIVFFDELATEAWDWDQPFPRGHLARVIDAVASAGARTIGLDVFLESEEPALNAIDQGDDLLEEALRRAGNVILVAPVERTDSGPLLRRPHARFADAAAAVGAADFPSSFETFRDGTLVVHSGAELAPSLALAMYAHASGLDLDSLLRSARQQGRVALPGLPDDVGLVPADWWQEGGDQSATHAAVPFALRYHGPPSSADWGDPPGTFVAVSSSTVAELAALVPEAFRDKIVLLGTGYHDWDKFRTPFYSAPTPPDTTGRGWGDTYTWMYGVEIHAHALQNMLDGEYVRPLGRGSLTLLLLLAASVTGAVTFWRGAGWGGASTLGAALLLSGTAFWLWAGRVYVNDAVLATLDERFLWLPLVSPVLAAVFGYVGSVAYVSMVEGKEKRFIKSAFGKYVSPAIVAEISEHPESLRLGGQKRTLSLLFSDLADFTAVSEPMDPQDLLALLNEYLSDMTQIVLDEGGFLDKYVGDAIMAFWNAPKEVPDHADRALRTMVLMQRRLHDLNERWRESNPDHVHLRVRIGVHSGEATVGNLGGEVRFDYSAVGDTVNLASRLEPANKTYGTLNMASEDTLALATRESYRLRELDLISVKGRGRPVKVYEVLELAGVAFSEERETMLRRYEAGMEAYKGHAWEEAERLFRDALDADPDDGPSRLYAERSAANAADPPPADWDFVVRRTLK